MYPTISQRGDVESEMEIQSRFEAGLEIFVMSGCTTIGDGAEPLRLRFKHSVDQGHLHFYELDAAIQS